MGNVTALRDTEGFMAKRYSQTKSPFKGILVGGLAAVVAALIYKGIFPLNGFGRFLTMGGVSLLVGYIGYVMGSGLDTTKEAPRQKEMPITGNAEVDRVVRRGQDMLAAIRRENDRIPDPVLSRQMDEMDSVANKIFKQVIDTPEKAPQIRRFMDYYLPTTLKMLTGYRRIEEERVSGRYAEDTKQKIEDAMDVVLSAFKKQLNTLYQNDMLDISTDIDVLETMLKQDSLLENGQTIQVQRNGAAAQAQQMKED